MKRTLSRFFGGLGLALALLVGVGFGSSAYAADYGRVLLLDPLLVCDSYGAEATRFELEQAYVANARDEHDDLASADLRREGQGYRQASADEYEGIDAPAATV